MPKQTSPPPLDWPVYWFAKLERAIEAGDYSAAATAQEVLERLGVTIRNRPHRPRNDQGGDI